MAETQPPPPLASYLSHTLDQLADVWPSEEPSRLAHERYHAAGATAASPAAAAEGPCAWMPRRVRSKEEVERAVSLIQSKLHEFNVALATQQAQQAADSAAWLSAPAAPPSGPLSPSRASPTPPPPPPPHAALPSATLFAPCAALSLYPPPPPVPIVPAFSTLKLLSKRVRALQSYLRCFEYNHLGSEFHPVSKTKSWDRCVQLAKTMMKEALPIKCLEALVLAAHLTSGWDDLVRFPLRFKTKSGKHSYWHIVLGLMSADGKSFGSVGLSRRATLDYRPLIFPALSALVCSFRSAYAEVGHAIHVITVGLPLPRKEFSQERIFWHFLQMPVLASNQLLLPTAATGMRSPRPATSSSAATTAAAPASSPSPPLTPIAAEWLVLDDLLDKFARASARLADVMKKAAVAFAGSSSSGSGGGSSTANAAHAMTQPLFVPPAAIKAACGVAPTAPILHAHVHYDSALVALVYKPAWSHAAAAAAAAPSTARTPRRSGACLSENDSATDRSDDDAASSAAAAAAEINSDEESEESSDGSSSDGDALPRSAAAAAAEEQKSTLPPGSPSAVAGHHKRPSAAKLHRLAERAERRRNRALVDELRDRYRHPNSVGPGASSAAAAGTAAACSGTPFDRTLVSSPVSSPLSRAKKPALSNGRGSTPHTLTAPSTPVRGGAGGGRMGALSPARSPQRERASVVSPATVRKAATPGLPSGSPAGPRRSHPPTPSPAPVPAPAGAPASLPPSGSAHAHAHPPLPPHAVLSMSSHFPAPTPPRAAASTATPHSARRASGSSSSASASASAAPHASTATSTVSSESKRLKSPPSAGRMRSSTGSLSPSLSPSPSPLPAATAASSLAAARAAKRASSTRAGAHTPLSGTRSPVLRAHAPASASTSPPLSASSSASHLIERLQRSGVDSGPPSAASAGSASASASTSARAVNALASSPWERDILDAEVAAAAAAAPAAVSRRSSLTATASSKSGSTTHR